MKASKRTKPYVEIRFMDYRESAALSQETVAYTARIVMWVGTDDYGGQIGIVSNDGRGGADLVYIHSGMRAEWNRFVEENKDVCAGRLNERWGTSCVRADEEAV